MVEQNQQGHSRVPVIKEACQQTVCFHKAFVTKGENRDRVSPPLQNSVSVSTDKWSFGDFNKRFASKIGSVQTCDVQKKTLETLPHLCSFLIFIRRMFSIIA